MSCAGKGVALWSRGPLRGSHLLHSPVVGPAWDVQGPADERLQVGSWTLQWGPRCGMGQPRGERRFRVLWGVSTGWKCLWNLGAGARHPSPRSPHLSPSMRPAETLSSGRAIFRIWESSKPWSVLWREGEVQGCSNPGVIGKVFTINIAETLANQNGPKSPLLGWVSILQWLDSGEIWGLQKEGQWVLAGRGQGEDPN